MFIIKNTYLSLQFNSCHKDCGIFHTESQAGASNLPCLGEALFLVSRSFYCFYSLSPHTFYLLSSQLLLLALFLPERGGSVRVSVKGFFTWRRKKKDPALFSHLLFILSVLSTPIPMISVISKTSVPMFSFISSCFSISLFSSNYFIILNVDVVD